MNLSMKWLKEFVDIDVDPKEFADKMTMSGSKVEGFETDGGKINNIVVGKILSIEKHPNADKLSVCKVCVGDENILQIITSAKNIQTDDLVPIALNNSTIADGTKITKGNLRGIKSEGMMCSMAELGISKADFPEFNENGILIIKNDVPCGKDIKEVLGFNDTIVEFEITSNRPDCFSIIGLAREASVTFDKPLKLHTPVVKAANGDCTPILKVDVQAPDLCKFYSTRIVRNVKIKESPKWMRERLRAMGVRPINNIVDITNYVMLEYGQPMHAFDFNYIDGSKIIVKKAQNGEKIKTLDGVERTLCSNDLLITDSKKPIAIAGVMGGEYSSINDNTHTIVFESANFSASSVRITSKALGLRTDSSAKFEKELDPNNCIPALNRACELVEMLDAGDVMDGIIYEDNSNYKQVSLPLDFEWINKFLNTNLSKEYMKDILKKLGCTFNGDVIIVPSYRQDLLTKADIAEEIARFYGYNNIKSTLMSGPCQGKYSKRQKFERTVKQSMLALGCSEIITYSFISEKLYDKIKMPKESNLRDSIKIRNPLGEDSSIMRTTAIPSMLLTLAKNYNNRNKDVSLFEIAKEYIKRSNDELPFENKKLIAGFYGSKVDFFYVKGIVEDLLCSLNINKYEFDTNEKEYAFHPGRCASVIVNGKEIGVLGEIHPQVADNFDIDTRVYVISLSMDDMYDNQNDLKTYTPLPKFPPVTRDLAFICDDNLKIAQLEKTISKAAGSLLENMELFDVYKGSQIGENKKSVAFSLTFRSYDKTLTDEQITSVTNNIIDSLKNIGAVLRF